MVRRKRIGGAFNFPPRVGIGRPVRKRKPLERLLLDLVAAVYRHQRRRRLALDCMGYRCDGRIDDRLVLDQQEFDLLGVDVFSPAGELVVGAPLEVEKALVVATEQIAGLQPAVDKPFRVEVGPVVIAQENRRRAHPQFARALALAAVLGHQLDRDPGRDQTATAARGRAAVSRLAQRPAAFGQPVGFDHPDREGPLDRGDQFGADHRGAHLQDPQRREVERGQEVFFGQHHPIHRRHAAGLGAAIARQRLEIRPRRETRQDHHRGTGVELRLDRHPHGVLVVERPGDQRALAWRGRPVTLRRSDSPEHAVMGEPHALGLPGRARRVGQEGELVGGDRRRNERRWIGLCEDRLVVAPPAGGRRGRDADRKPRLVGDRFDPGMATR